VTEAFVEKVWARYSETRDLNVVLVCHEETVNALLHHFLGLAFTGFQTFKLAHTSITSVNSRMHRPRVTAVNDTAHLLMAGLPTGASGTGRAAQ
jgi:broad specificity phosphatase PhoE